MKKVKKILLIDPATSGISGLYIHEIYSKFENNEFMEVAVSRYYPFDYGLKIFYKFSDLAMQFKYKLGKLRLYIRFIELLLSQLYLIVYILKKKPEKVIYALSGTLKIEYFFLYIIKHITKINLSIICHDVVPFIYNNESFESKVRLRRKFFILADNLIVHNKNSLKDLKEVYNINNENIKLFPFPIMDVNLLKLKPITTLSNNRNFKKFLFIGHLRKEKGINILLDAWKTFYTPEKNSELIIAGNIPSGFKYDFINIEQFNVKLKTKYLKDDEYFNLINQSDCVILPYLRGTNSGILSNIISLKKNIIVSDIEMFKSYFFIPDICFFKSGDVDSLINRINYFNESDENIFENKKVNESILDYITNFKYMSNDVIKSL